MVSQYGVAGTLVAGKVKNQTLQKIYRASYVVESKHPMFRSFQNHRRSRHWFPSQRTLQQRTRATSSSDLSNHTENTILRRLQKRSSKLAKRLIKKQVRKGIRFVKPTRAKIRKWSFAKYWNPWI